MAGKSASARGITATTTWCTRDALTGKKIRRLGVHSAPISAFGASEQSWLWQGFVQPVRLTSRGLHVGGYGDIGYRGKGRPVHRVMWMLVKGPIPPKMDVCHECDVRHCCNPDHLWLGTRKQNLLDMADKKRGNKASKTHCKHGHPLSGDNVRLSNNGRRRSCKECQRLRGLRPDVRAMQTAAQKRRRARLRAERAQGASV